MHTQIDHIIISSKWKNSLSDKEVQRGVDVWSDHRLLMATLTINLHKTKFQRPRQPLSLNSETASKPSRKKWWNLTSALFTIGQ